MSYLKRKVACGICGWYPIVNVDKRTIHCVCCREGCDIPQWILVSSYNFKQWRKEFVGISQAMFEEMLKLMGEATHEHERNH